MDTTLKWKSEPTRGHSTVLALSWGSPRTGDSLGQPGPLGPVVWQLSMRESGKGRALHYFAGADLVGAGKSR